MKQQIANTILRQLGSNRFVTMTCAKDFLYGEDDGSAYLSFRIGRGALKSINYVKITLMPSDTYKVEFKKTSSYRGNFKVTDIETVEDVYADMLQSVFTQVTGFYTSLY